MGFLKRDLGCVTLAKSFREELDGAVCGQESTSAMCVWNRPKEAMHFRVTIHCQLDNAPSRT
eukprot:4326469-Amphidinium_carterae.1